MENKTTQAGFSLGSLALLSALVLAASATVMRYAADTSSVNSGPEAKIAAATVIQQAASIRAATQSLLTTATLQAAADSLDFGVDATGSLAFYSPSAGLITENHPLPHPPLDVNGQASPWYLVSSSLQPTLPYFAVSPLVSSKVCFEINKGLGLQPITSVYAAFVYPPKVNQTQGHLSLTATTKNGLATYDWNYANSLAVTNAINGTFFANAGQGPTFCECLTQVPSSINPTQCRAYVRLTDVRP